MNVHRRDVFLVLAAALLPVGALAQGADGGVTQEILALREKIRAAAAAKDKAALQALYLDNFAHLRDSGRVDLKAERIALILSGEPAIETAPEEDVDVRVYGASTASATGGSAIKDPGTGRNVKFRWLVVYVKTDAGWRVALSQASRVPARRS